MKFLLILISLLIVLSSSKNNYNFDQLIINEVVRSFDLTGRTPFCEVKL